jgi:hypothetical protein
MAAAPCAGPLRSVPANEYGENDSFGLSVLLANSTHQAPPAAHSIFFIFFTGKK